MKKNLIILLTILLFPLLLITGVSSWVIVGEKSLEVGTNASSSTYVCYINSDTEGNRYTRIEKALEVASSTNKDVVYVKPKTNPTIYKDCVIKSGVTLCLPYEGTTYENTARSLTSLFADADSTSVEKNRQNSVKVAENVKITNNGTIIIGGEIGIGASQKLTGHTAGKYCEIVMGKNASIDNNSGGIINCFGYIKEAFPNTESQINLFNGSTIFLQLVLYDFKGGTYSSAAVTNNVMPFDVYDFPNSHVTMNFYYGSKLTGRVTVNVRGIIMSEANVIYTSNALFLMKSESSQNTGLIYLC